MGRNLLIVAALLIAGCTTVEGCPEGFTECGEQCIDLTRDQNNCGACGQACVDGQICDGAGACALTCQAGFLECDGVCRDPQRSRLHCGACGQSCSAGQVCVDGACAPTCPTDSLACGDTCADPLTDRRFCGASGDCLGANAGVMCVTGEVCVAGVCEDNCPPGFLACGGRCVDPRFDRAFCGASDTCEGEDAGQVCADGELCAMGACAVECPVDLVACDGRCIDPETDIAFCGASGNCVGGRAGRVCGPGEVCAGGRCEITCPVGLIDCNGRCVDPLSDAVHCGASGSCTGTEAGRQCTGGRVCDGGECLLSCLPGSVQCGTRCIDPSVNNRFCGASGDCVGADAGAECGDGTVCSGGVCQATCAEGTVVCSGVCTDPLIHPIFCGATGDCLGANAGTACMPGEICVDGACTTECTTGLIECGTQCVDPATNPSFCGATGDCLGANAGTVCTAGQACLGGVCVDAGGGGSETEIFDVLDRGWWNATGEHQPDNQNTFTGYIPAPTDAEFRSYFRFDLTGDVEDATVIESVTLRLEYMPADFGNPAGGWFTPDATETYSIWDVSTDATTLDSEANPTLGTANVAVFTDIGTGTSYATGTLQETDQGTIITIPLNASAVAGVLAALGGSFAVGMTNDTIDTTRAENDGFRFANGNDSWTHQLVVRYRTGP
jgi:hypothetical protein